MAHCGHHTLRSWNRPHAADSLLVDQNLRFLVARAFLMYGRNLRFPVARGSCWRGRARAACPCLSPQAEFACPTLPQVLLSRMNTSSRFTRGERAADTAESHPKPKAERHRTAQHPASSPPRSPLLGPNVALAGALSALHARACASAPAPAAASTAINCVLCAPPCWQSWMG